MGGEGDGWWGGRGEAATICLRARYLYSLDTPFTKVVFPWCGGSLSLSVYVSVCVLSLFYGLFPVCLSVSVTPSLKPVGEHSYPTVTFRYYIKQLQNKYHQPRNTLTLPRSWKPRIIKS